MPVSLLDISPQKRKYQPDETEYKINTHSHVVPKRNLSFQWKSSLVSELQKLEDVNGRAENTCIKVGDIVRVTAKVVSKSVVETAFSNKMNKILTKCDIIISNSTNTMRLTLWEQEIEMVELNLSYNCTYLRLCHFNGKYIELSQKSRTTVAYLKPKKKEAHEIDGCAVAVDIEKQYA